MRVRFDCAKCAAGSADQSVYLDVSDDGVYTVICEQSHRSVQTISNPKFEVLFEMALLAFADGYTRECVASLAASAEEFYRLFVKTYLYRAGYEPIAEDVKSLWKVISRAEPQLGAFALAYFLEFKKPPSFPDNKSTEFRNGVIHAGKIPTPDEVRVYADKMITFIVPVYATYQEKMHLLITSAYDQYNSIAKRDGDRPHSGIGYQSTFQRLAQAGAEATFDTAVKMAREVSFLKPSAA
jgi:hypothetical protein